MLRKNVASQFVHIQGVDVTTGGIKSGVTWTMRRCLDGTFAAGGATVTEDSTNGWYKVALTQADTNGNDIGYNFTGTGAVPQTINVIATAADPTDSVRFGLTALPNAAAEAAGGLYTRGSGAGQINQAANGNIDANTVKVSGTAQTARDIGQAVPNAAFGATGGLGPAVMRGGTAQTGTTATITLDAGGSATDDLYAGATITIASGTGAGQTRSIISYVGSTKVATVGSNWAIVPDNTSVFVITALGLIAATGFATSTDVASILAALASVQADLPITLTKNVPLSGFMFPMYLSSDHVSPATGKSVTATRSLDAGTFTAMANSVVEISNGWYYINLTSADTNGNTFAYNFAATACDTTKVSGATQP